MLASNLSHIAFQTWFAPLVPLAYENNKLVLQVKSQFVAEYIEDTYIDLLSKVIFHVFGSQTTLEYKVLIDSVSGGTSVLPSQGNADIKIKNDYSAANPIDVKAPHYRESITEIDSHLNQSYTFANFVAGEPNKLARIAGVTISEKPGYTAFNPLFIYGGSGVGKTHLANAIGNQIKLLDPSKNVLYVSANEFKLQYQNASLNNQIPEFLNYYQHIDVLIVDDIQYFSNLKGTQDTFFHIFNYLQQSHKQLVLTSDRSPVQLKDIEDRLLTRFKWGLNAEIMKPDYELRRDILLNKMQRDGITLPEEVVDYVATHVTESIRDIEGVLASLLAYSTLLNKDIDVALAEQVVARVVNTTPRNIQIEDIVTAVGEHMNVPAKSILAVTRTHEVVLARHIVIYLAKQLTDHSLTEIGNCIGKRTHATVLHALKTITDQIEANPVLSHRINHIKSVMLQH